MNIKNSTDKVIWPILLSVPFLAQLFALERHRNGFLEYDLHFLPICVLALVSAHCYWAFRQGSVKAQSSLNLLDLALLSGVVYFTIQYLIIPRLSYRDIYLCWLWLILFFCYKYSRDYFPALSIGLAILLAAVCLLQISNIQIIPSMFFVKDATKINAGDNANYYATALPFLLAMLLKSRKSLWPATGYAIATAACIYFSCTARTATIAAIVGAIFVISRALTGRIPFFLKTGGILVLPLTWFLYGQNPNSIRGRLLIYKVCFKMVVSKPITGIGLDRFRALYNWYQGQYMQVYHPPIAQQLLAGDTFYAFNEFLQIGIEMGVVGLIILSIIVVIVKWKAAATRDLALIGSIGSLLSIAICSLSSYPLHSLPILVNGALFLALVSQSMTGRATVVIRKGWYIGLLVFCLISAVYEEKRAVALYNWEIAANRSITGQYDLARESYSRAQTMLSMEGPFLYNYGAETLIAGDSVTSLAYLETAVQYYSSSNLYLYLGENYKALGRMTDAEKAYTIAENIQPARFLPKFRLLQLYQQCGLAEKAIEMAKIIDNFPVKISSSEVNAYKAYARTFLRSESGRKQGF